MDKSVSILAQFPLLKIFPSFILGILAAIYFPYPTNDYIIYTCLFIALAFIITYVKKFHTYRFGPYYGAIVNVFIFVLAY